MMLSRFSIGTIWLFSIIKGLISKFREIIQIISMFSAMRSSLGLAAWSRKECLCRNGIKWACVEDDDSIHLLFHCAVGQVKAALLLSEEGFREKYHAEKPQSYDHNIVFYGLGPIKSHAALELAKKAGYALYVASPSNTVCASTSLDPVYRISPKTFTGFFFLFATKNKVCIAERSIFGIRIKSPGFRTNCHSRVCDFLKLSTGKYGLFLLVCAIRPDVCVGVATTFFPLKISVSRL